MQHTIGLNETITIRVIARESYSTDGLVVTFGEHYKFSCHPDECWVDWYLPSSPDGITNVFAWLAGLRVRDAKCFCLCAAYHKHEGGFGIGSAKNITITQNGTLWFFANDAKNAYGNNRGIITLNIKRIK